MSFATPIDEANHFQRLAADPRRNVFVSANAGSGKTHVLVGRVTRLLLSGVQPDRIMCLTYTKAAATEMQERLFETLGKWSVMEDERLRDILLDLTGSAAQLTEDFIARARRLFARALEAPEGLKIQTIHAFCETLLRRFPVEAGISPDFQALDDLDGYAFGAEVKTRLLSRAAANPQSELAQSLLALTADYSDSVLDEMVSWAIGHAWRIGRWQEADIDRLAESWGLDPGKTETDYLAAHMRAVPHQDIAGELPALWQGTEATDQKLARIIEALQASPKDAATYLDYENAILTDNKLRAGITTKGVNSKLFGRRDTKNKIEYYGPEARRIFAVRQTRLLAAIADRTRRAFHLLKAACDIYETLKRQLRILDFNDQIHLARALLQNSAARQWVRYKVDQGAGHILIDEAQDTAPEQWDIFDAITDAFGDVQEDHRTHFAVGDEKQSIYGFQGAEPENFLSRTQGYIASLPDPSTAPQLSVSFRSAQSVLALVDAVFAAHLAGRKFIRHEPEKYNPVNHIGVRQDIGRIEVWPLIEKDEAPEDEDAWTPPVDSVSASDPIERLARQISIELAARVAQGQLIYDRDLKRERRLRAGDILVLTQSRSPLFRALLRHLKLAGLDVAGADRITLSEDIAVQDLMSLARFCAFPDDDLSLAEVLKSPIFGLSEDQLMALAMARPGTLWAALNGQVPPALFEARAVLRRFLALSRSDNAHSFFAQVLSFKFSDGDSVKKRFRARLGAACLDPLEAFLGRALAYQRQAAPTLHGFIQLMGQDKSEIKRQPHAMDEVRVMTVHGAKGLEAPLVVLPDCDRGYNQTRKDNFVFHDTKDQGLVLLPRSGDFPELLSDIPEDRNIGRHGEYLRLLYVALTRAESQLILCGVRNSKTFNPDKKDSDDLSKPWYYYIQDALSDAASPLKTQSLTLLAAEHKDVAITVIGENLRYDAEGAPERHQPGAARLEPWARMPAPENDTRLRRAAPSQLLPDETAQSPALRSPLSLIKSRPDPYLRGNIIHKLLELLPEMAPEQRQAAARAFAARFDGFTKSEQDDIVNKVMGVLTHPDFAPFFAHGSEAEVSLIGRGADMPPDLQLAAKIDRLAVTEDTVWIIDYKSNRPPPKNAADVAPIYLAQMAAYQRLARQIWPRKTVRCALLWTETPELMELPDALLSAVNFGAKPAGS